MNFSQERSVTYLQVAAQALYEENQRLRQAHEAAISEAARLQQSQEAIVSEAERLRQTQEATVSEIERLRQAYEAIVRETARLEALEKAMETENAAMRLQVAERESQNAELAERLAALNAEMAALRELLAQRDKQLFGKKSERRPAKNADKDKSKDSDKKKKPKEKQKGHGPTKQPDLPVVEVEHSLVGDGLKCDHCGGTLEALGTAAEESELIALEARKIILERHIQNKYQCPCCHTGVKTAPGPVKLVPGGRYSLDFIVHVAIQKFLGHMPFKRQAAMFQHDGLRVSVNTLCDQMDALATALFPVFLAMWKATQAEDVLHADETPWAVLANGHTDNERFYTWCVVGSQYTIYRTKDSRSKDAALTLLGDFSGTLIVDGLSSYTAAAKNGPGNPPRFTIANCHAHARRKFVDCEKNWPAESGYVIALYHELYEIERLGKEPGADLLTLRQTQSKPLINQLFAWAKEQMARPDVPSSSGLAKALSYLVNIEAGLRIFLENPAVNIDNNPAERAMRTPVLGRKNFYGSRSRRGAENAAVMYTIIEGAKRVGVSPYAYIMAAVEYALANKGAILLPEEFKRQLDAVREPPVTA